MENERREQKTTVVIFDAVNSQCVYLFILEMKIFVSFSLPFIWAGKSVEQIFTANRIKGDRLLILQSYIHLFYIHIGADERAQEWLTSF